MKLPGTSLENERFYRNFRLSNNQNRRFLLKMLAPFSFTEPTTASTFWQAINKKHVSGKKKKFFQSFTLIELILLGDRCRLKILVNITLATSQMMSAITTNHWTSPGHFSPAHTWLQRHWTHLYFFVFLALPNLTVTATVLTPTCARTSPSKADGVFALREPWLFFPAGQVIGAAGWLAISPHHVMGERCYGCCFQGADLLTSGVTLERQWT